MRVVGFLLLSALVAGGRWAIDRAVAASRSGDDMSYSAQLARSQSKALGFATIVLVVLSAVVGTSALIGLPAPVVWGVVAVSLFAVLPLVRWLGLRFPALGLPTSFDDPDVDLGSVAGNWATIAGFAFVFGAALVLLFAT